MQWVAMALLCTLSACAEADRETQMRVFVEAAVGAAEARDTGHFRDVVAASYRDDRGSDRDRIIDVIRGFFLINPQIEADAEIVDIVWDGTQSVRLTLELEVEGRSNRYAGEVEFELLRHGGDWRVIGARWDPGERRAKR